MTCPRCRTETLLERAGRVDWVDVCLGCGGVWLDRGELERTVDDAIEAFRVRHEASPSRVRFYGDPPPPATAVDAEERPRSLRARALTRRAS